MRYLLTVILMGCASAVTPPVPCEMGDAGAMSDSGALPSDGPVDGGSDASDGSSALLDASSDAPRCEPGTWPSDRGCLKVCPWIDAPDSGFFDLVDPNDNADTSALAAYCREYHDGDSLTLDWASVESRQWCYTCN